MRVAKSHAFLPNVVSPSGEIATDIETRQGSPGFDQGLLRKIFAPMAMRLPGTTLDRMTPTEAAFNMNALTNVLLEHQFRQMLPRLFSGGTDPRLTLTKKLGHWWSAGSLIILLKMAVRGTTAPEENTHAKDDGELAC